MCLHPINTSLGIMKKWIEALKGEIYTTQTFEYFLKAFTTFFSRSPSADSMRSLALYITYAIHKPRQAVPYPTRGKSIKLDTNVSSRRQTSSSTPPRSTKQQDESVSYLSQLEVALKMLEFYTDFLCHKGDVANIKKFARTVTNKVITTAAHIHNRYLLLSVASSSPC